MKESENHWWIEPDWDFVDEDNIRRTKRENIRSRIDHINQSYTVTPQLVYDILQDAIILYRNYFYRDTKLKLEDKMDMNSWMYPSIIIQHLAKIVEIVHNVNVRLGPNSEEIAARGDTKASQLMNFRNIASHFDRRRATKL
ncbi:MAG: hypothetical protein IPK08_19740, partial [Bacteroidetes bacterium]|nr:hypothetical protein [Bacteroidota bacterium]